MAEREENELPEKLMDYLYDEMPSLEKPSFKEKIQTDPELLRELRAFNELRNLYRTRLKDAKVPSALTRQIYERLGIKKPWYGFFTEGAMLRPVLVGAMALFLTIGLTRMLHNGKSTSTIVSQIPPVVAPHPELTLADIQPPSRSLRPVMHAPSWRPQPSIGDGLVSYASFGPSTFPQADDMVRSYDIPHLEQQAVDGVARFAHQQALRSRILGDYKEAAAALARVIKAYPDYPGKFEALAQRIDCLFRMGEVEKAKRELIWLGAFAPELAYIVADRWAGQQ